ncbi:retrotransposon protein, putative, Ty1-copia subclass [Cucumis melo var. makuwa]|uniref:Retrotransposon protein, putative, Ty1-copia subclass n=1 Tax=Cucumis melo var. makuwa TaxID=1194695 RepID=A0A5A7VKC2_CUCMM|nr:retrotransposon protein, putative, Ty1-copia subclass [Cucumis melo var. makuwa]TYJ97155.1 retrotransposon protein, putative, Ty1-copia subclass [Cucumis melo var. makuwa]
MASTRFEMSKFNGNGDFAIWRKKIRVILVQHKVAKILDEEKLPENITESEKRDMDEMTYSTILLYLSDEVLRLVDEATTTGELWKKLESLYLTKFLPNKEKFFRYKMDQSKSLEENLDEFQKIIVDLSNIGEKMSDENQAVILLNSLPETYREVKAAIKYGRDSLTMSIVLDALKTRNLEIKKERKDGELLMARGRSEKKSWKGKERSSRSKSKGKSRKCFLCHKGHFKKNCPLNKSREASTSEANVTDGYNFAEITDGYESAEVLMVSHRDIQDAWIMDSGCTFHMTPHRDFLTNFQKGDGGKVLLGDNGICDVKRTGSVQIATHDEMVRILTNVRYVPKLKRNLISLGELDRSGCTIKSENGVMKVTKGSLVKLRGTLRHGLYVLEGTTVSGSTAIASGKVTYMFMLWHNRLAHVSERGLQALSQQGLLEGVKNVELSFCEHCIMGKCTRVQFGKGKHTTKGILDYVHSDLWGPTKEAFMGGSRYFISIIDDFSRKVWIYPLKQKDEAFGKFLEWKKQVEKQTGKAPSLDHLKVFGCTTYAHVKDGKLNKRALKCMFIGYPQGVKKERKQQTSDHVVTKVRIASEGRPSVGLYAFSDQPPLVSKIEDTQQSEFDGIQSQQERILIDEGAFIEESSSNNDLQNYQLTRDRAQRERHAPIRYGYADLVAYALTCAADGIEEKPLTFEKAIVSDSKKRWKDVMEVELFSLHKNQTWSLVPKPLNQKLIQSKWIYKIKPGTWGNSKPRYKARLVAKGYTQKEGVDFHEVFSPVVRHSSIRLILSIAVHFDMFIEQMDVTTTFLHGELEEVIYMAHLRAMRDSTGTHMMLVFTGNYLRKLSNEFEMKDLGELKRILGMDVKRDRKKGLSTISQESYVIKLLEKYNISGSKAVSTPLASYFRLSSSQCPVTKQERPDLGYVMSMISRFMSNPGKEHWKVVKWVLRYLKGSTSVSLCYSRDYDKSTLLEGFTDADYVADLDKRRSLSGHIFRLYGNVVSWKVNLQPVVALSTTESEYISLGEAVKEAVRLQRIVGELLSQEFIPIIHCDSQSAIYLAKNPYHHERSKHIDVKFHYIRNVIA